MSQHCYTQSTVDITSSANKQNLIFMPSQSSAKYHVGEAITITQNKSPQKATFKFVVLDGPTIIDPEAKRLIKKHVMADIGRSRRKRTKWSDEKLGMVKGSPNTFDIFVPPIPRFGAGRDPFVKYPIEMSSRLQKLVDHIYPEIATFEYFLPIALSDPASFHALLALLTFHVRIQLRPHEHKLSTDYESMEITIHHIAALAYLRKRVVDIESATSDGTISAILWLLTLTNISTD